MIIQPRNTQNVSSILSGGDKEKKPEFRQGEMILKVREYASEQMIQQLESRIGSLEMTEVVIPPIMRESETLGFKGMLFHVKLRPGVSVEEGMRRASGIAPVEYAEPNYIYHLVEPVKKRESEPPQASSETRAEGENVPNDLDSRLWGLKNTGQTGGTPGADISAVGAWNVTTGTKTGPVAAVIDTGVDYTHEDLHGNIWNNPKEIPGNNQDDDGNGYVDDVHGVNVIRGTGDPMDDHSHGTHVSGTIAAEGNNGKGIVGVNWQAQIMGAKFLSSGGSGTLEDAIKAISYATQMGARVTSNSWGGGGYSQALYEVLKASPALHIFAAGNESNDNDRSPAYPATYDLPNIVSVAASDHNDQLADFSNWGKTTVDLAAPGVDVYSTIPGNRFASFDGTSMATPHVTGAVLLILSKFPTLNNDQIKARLTNTADRKPAFDGMMVSNGRLNVAAALEDDSVPPAMPTDLKVTEAKALSATLTWIAPGDDGMEGQATYYDLRMADRPIVDGPAGEGEVSFEEAARMATPPPQAAGSQEQVTVSVPPSTTDKTYYFALKAVDRLGNYSGMATASATTKPAATLFLDDAESADKWTAEEPWGREEVADRGKVWSDSPKGAYGDNANTSITSVPISLAGASKPVLYFSERHDLEARYDFVHLEVSNDGGKNWKQLLKLGGTSDWQSRSVNLSAYEGQTIQLRFRLTSDSSVVKDGVQIDDIWIAGEPADEAPVPGESYKAFQNLG